MTLPTNEGDRLVLWTSDDDGSETTRVSLVSDGADRWAMDIQIGYEGDPRDDVDADYVDDDGMIWDGGGAIRPHEWSEFYLDLTKLVMDCNRIEASLIETMSKGKCEIPLRRKDVTLLRRTGSERVKVTLKLAGDDSWGRPFFTIDQSRPLTKAEWFVVVKRMAKACDAYDQLMGDAS